MVTNLEVAHGIKKKKKKKKKQSWKLMETL